MKITRTLIVIVGIIYNFLIALGPLVLYQFINNITAYESYIYLLLYAIILISQVIFGYIDMRLLWKNEKITKYYYHYIINNKYLKIDFKNNENFNINNIISFNNNVLDMHEYIENKLMFIRYIIAFIVYSAFLFVFIKYYLLLVLIIMIVIYILSNLPNKFLYNTRIKYLKCREKLMNDIRNLFNNHIYFKKYAKEKIENLYNKTNNIEQVSSYKNENVNKIAQGLNAFYFDLLKLLVLVVCVYLISNNILAVASSISIYLYSKYIFELFDSLLFTKNNMKNYKSSFEPINRFLNLKEINAPVSDFGFIEFKNAKLTNKYLNLSINCKIIKNNKYLILGENGSGKSTLLKMLASLISFDCDNVYLNDRQFKEVNTSNLILYSNNEPIIFNANFNDNITVFNTLIKKMNFDSYPKISSKINELSLIPNAYNLSSGEKQFVAFVRSCLTDHQIYIYDEAFSKINKELCYEIFLYLCNCNKTIILVDHNFEYDVRGFKNIVFEEKFVYEQKN